MRICKVSAAQNTQRQSPCPGDLTKWQAVMAGQRPGSWTKKFKKPNSFPYRDNFPLRNYSLVTHRSSVLLVVGVTARKPPHEDGTREVPMSPVYS